MNLLGVSDPSYHGSNSVSRTSQPSKHRDLGVPRSSKEYYVSWKTGVASSSTSAQSGFCQQSDVSERTSLRISGTNVTDTLTPRAGGTDTPITHVTPQPTKMKHRPMRIKPQPTKPIGVHRKLDVRTLVVDVDSLPVTTVCQSRSTSRTVTSSKIKGQSPSNLTRTTRDKYTKYT